MKNEATIMDALYNTTTACTHGNYDLQNYAKGVLVGVVAVIMGQGATFGQAIATLADIRKKAYWYKTEPTMDMECVPECWRNEFHAYGMID